MKYLMTLKFDVDAIDDVEARSAVVKILKMFNVPVEEMTKHAKLQEVFTDKAPRKVAL